MRQSKYHRDIPNEPPKHEYYAIKVSRPEELNDSQWKSFCKLMDAEDFEQKCLWDAVDDITLEVQEK